MKRLTALYISIGAALGALIRWWFGMTMNAIFPAIPFGTLTANISGGFLMGVIMALTRNAPFMPEELRLALTTGFLGGLTTFSTFSAETVTLLSHQEYLFAFLIMISHVGGSLLATMGGIYLVKLFV